MQPDSNDPATEQRSTLSDVDGAESSIVEDIDVIMNPDDNDRTTAQGSWHRVTNKDETRSQSKLEIIRSDRIDRRACWEAAEGLVKTIPFPILSSARVGFKRWLSTNSFWGNVLLIDSTPGQILKVWFERYSAAQAYLEFVRGKARQMPEFSTPQECEFKRVEPHHRISSELTRTLVIDAERRPNDPIAPWQRFSADIHKRFPNLRGEVNTIPLWTPEQRRQYEAMPDGDSGNAARRDYHCQHLRFLAVFNSVAEAMWVRAAMDPNDPARSIPWPRSSGFTCKHGLDISEVEYVCAHGISG